MSANTNIEWCDHTFNPWEGCQKVGPGCDHCYAEARNARFGGGTAVNWGPGAPRRRTSAANWKMPLRWNTQADAFMALNGRRQRVFCASLADVFDNAVPETWRIDLFALIEQTPNIDWLLLTKRIGNAAEFLPWSACSEPWPNVWIGATVVNQVEADRDISKLANVSAHKRFLSMEPLLGSVDIRKWLDPWTCADCGFHGGEHDCGPDGCEKCGESGAFGATDLCKSCGADDQSAKPSCPRCEGHRSYERDYGFKFDAENKLIDWVIVGGESGPGARPMHPSWVVGLRDQCQATGVPFLFKQWGEWQPISQMSDDDLRPLYRSRVKARAHQDQDAIDGSYGRTCTVGHGVVHQDGSLHDILEPMSFLQGSGAMQAFKVGKKSTGRLLDGRTWDEVPK